MNNYDKDNMFCAMPFWNLVDKWLKSSESELPIKDKKKLELVSTTLMQLFRSVAKDMGKDGFDAMLQESKQYDFLIAPKDANIGEHITGTFQDTINLGVLKKAVENSESECYLCTRDKDFTKCGWYAIHSLIDPPPKNCHECPYKKSLFD